MNSAQIAEVFENIAGPLEVKGDVVFKIRAYQRAARAIKHLPLELAQPLKEGKDLKEIPGIGQAISEKVNELGVPLVISTGSHTASHLENMRFGVTNARRGWCEAKHILNSKPLEEFASFLQEEKTQRMKVFAGDG